jgi:hypothetical protein
LVIAPYFTPNIIRHAMAAITGDTMAGMAGARRRSGARLRCA